MALEVRAELLERRKGAKILQVHAIYIKYLPIFEIPEIHWTTLSKFFLVLTKNSSDIGLQKCAHFAGICSIHQIFAHFQIPKIQWTTLSKLFLVPTKKGRDIGLQSCAHFAGTCSIHKIFAHFWNPWVSLDQPVQVLLKTDNKMAKIWSFKVVLILQVHAIYIKFLPTFEIPEITWTTLSKFLWVPTKNGWDICLQSCAHFAGTCYKHQMFAHFLNPWDPLDPPFQVILSSNKKWQRYRLSKLCSLCRYMRYTPNFCPFLKSLSFNGPPSPSFVLSSDKKGPRYGPSKLCSFCRYMRYTTNFSPFFEIP